MSEEKTFKVVCVHCKQPFHVRYPLARPGAEGERDVVANCLYCGKDVVIRIPTQYVAEDHLVRGLKSIPAGS